MTLHSAKFGKKRNMLCCQVKEGKMLWWVVFTTRMLVFEQHASSQSETGEREVDIEDLEHIEEITASAAVASSIQESSSFMDTTDVSQTNVHAENSLLSVTTEVVAPSSTTMNLSAHEVQLYC